MTGAAVDVRDVSLSFWTDEGWQPTLKDVDLRLEPSEVLALVGESGCGKSTVAGLMMGWMAKAGRIDGGSVMLDGQDMLSLPRRVLNRVRGRKVATCPQNPTTSLNPAIRVGGQVEEVLKVHTGLGRRERQARILELLQQVQITDAEAALRRYPHQLSGGQQQRVMIAMAMACEPEVLVFDEPMTGLDVITKQEILELLRQLKRDRRLSILYVTHDLGEVAQIADRVAVMYAGIVVEVASTARLFGAPRHPYARGLIRSVRDVEAGAISGEPALKGILRREDLPAGCPFAPRCDHAAESCWRTPQALEDVAERHQVACQEWRMLPPFALPDEVPPSDGPQDAREPVLELENVTLRYGAATVINDVSFFIGRGEVFALIGESGSGKSTIARAIVGLLDCAEGEIRFEGQRLANRDKVLRRKIQLIFQNPDASLNPRETVETCLTRSLRWFEPDLSRAEQRERVAEALQDVRLPESFAARYPDQLSGGERQRVAIARALVVRPDVLLCDEILSALDVSVQANLLRTLIDLRASRGITMLFISHDVGVVRALADRIAILYHGDLCEMGSVRDVVAGPSHPYSLLLEAAVPDLDPASAGRARVQPREAGAVDRTSACTFANQCLWFIGPVCEKEPPPLRTFGPHHHIRCHQEPDEIARRSDAFRIDPALGPAPP